MTFQILNNPLGLLLAASYPIAAAAIMLMFKIPDPFVKLVIFFGFYPFLYTIAYYDFWMGEDTQTPNLPIDQVAPYFYLYLPAFSAATGIVLNLIFIWPGVLQMANLILIHFGCAYLNSVLLAAMTPISQYTKAPLFVKTLAYFVFTVAATSYLFLLTKPIYSVK